MTVRTKSAPQAKQATVEQPKRATRLDIDNELRNLAKVNLYSLFPNVSHGVEMFLLDEMSAYAHDF